MAHRRVRAHTWLGPPLAVALAAMALVTATGTDAVARAATPRRAATACDPVVDLTRWSLARLAATTVAVPIGALDVAAVAPEVRTGYGGILLFGATAPSNLGATLRADQAATPQHLGTLVMTDEEGGEVRRLDNLVGAFPWARTMAQTMTPTAITVLARRVGTQLAAAGVTTDLAPVLDVDGRDVLPGARDPDGYRSFGGSVAVVTRDGEAFAKGLAQAHVGFVVKHFPGLGGATGNTDDGPAATRPWPQLEAGGLEPFVSAIGAGATAVMVANARVPGLTPLPATLSSKVMTTELRDRLHFTGLIVTDSLTALAITDLGLTAPTAAVDAIAAGADLVLLGDVGSASRDVALAVSVANGIAAAVARGSLPRSVLQAAAALVLATHGVIGCNATT